jgi:hypothetical protein
MKKLTQLRRALQGKNPKGGNPYHDVKGKFASKGQRAKPKVSPTESLLHAHGLTKTRNRDRQGWVHYEHANGVRVSLHKAGTWEVVEPLGLHANSQERRWQSVPLDAVLKQVIR